MIADPTIQREIERVVSILLKKYHNRDPFFIARKLGVDCTILDLTDDLPAFSVRKDYQDAGHIYINQKYGTYARKILCAHELGHLCLHGEYGDTFFDSEIEPEKEYEANLFAVMLMPQIILNKEDILNQSIEVFNNYMSYRVNWDFNIL